MRKTEAYELLVREYLGKLKSSFAGCDGCIAEYYCITNHLKTARVPQPDCPEKLKAYLRQRIIKRKQ